MARDNAFSGDHDDQLRLAEDLDIEIVELRKLLVSLEERISNIASAWKGDSADEYLKKLDAAYDELRDICRKTEAATAFSYDDR